MIRHLLRPSVLALALAAASCGGDRAPASEPAGEAPAGGLAIVDPEDPLHPETIDLGELDLGEVVRRTVRLRNREGRPLTIESIRPGCTCTVPRIAYVDGSGRRVEGDARGTGDVLVLPPGATAELELVVDTRIAPATNKPKLVVVRITTDSELDPYTTLSLRMFVSKPFSPAPAVIDLQQVAVHGVGEGHTDILPLNEEGLQLAGVLETPDDVEASIERVEVGQAFVWRLRVRLLPPQQPGLVQRTIRLRTTGPGGEGEGRPLEIPMRARIVADVALQPEILLLQPQVEGEPASASTQLVSHLAGQRLRVVASRLEGDHADLLRVELAPQRPDDDGRARVWDVRLVATGPLPAEPFAGELVLALDDPQNPELRARYMHHGS